MQNLGIWGLTGTGIEIRCRKCHIWNRRSWFAYVLCNFYGATMVTKSSLLLSAPVVKRFRSKKVPFGAKIWRFWGINIDRQPRALWSCEQGTNIWAHEHTGFNPDVCREPPAACTSRCPLKGASKCARSYIRVPSQTSFKPRQSINVLSMFRKHPMNWSSQTLAWATSPVNLRGLYWRCFYCLVSFVVARWHIAHYYSGIGLLHKIIG